MAIYIDDRLIEELEEQYDSEEIFEEIPKGSVGRRDSKKISDKGERKKCKEERMRKKNGKWGKLQEMMGIDNDQYAW